MVIKLSKYMYSGDETSSNLFLRIHQKVEYILKILNIKHAQFFVTLLKKIKILNEKQG
jgi:hypothetical protein